MSSNPTTCVEQGEDVDAHAEELNLQPPDSVAVIPQNFFSAETQSDLKLNQESITVEKLLEEEGIDTDELIDSTDHPVSHTWSAETIGPLIHFTAEFIANNWAGVLTVISIIQTYYSNQRTESVQFTFNVERPDGTTKAIQYEGPPEELDSVTDLIKEEGGEAIEPGDDAMEVTNDNDESETIRHDEEESESA